MIRNEKIAKLQHKITCWAKQMPREELINTLNEVTDYYVAQGYGSLKKRMCDTINAYQDRGLLDELNGGQIGDFVLHGDCLERTVITLAKLCGHKSPCTKEYALMFFEHIPEFHEDINMDDYGSTEELLTEFRGRVLEFMDECQELIDEVNNE